MIQQADFHLRGLGVLLFLLLAPGSSTTVFAKQEVTPSALQASPYDSIGSEQQYWTLLRAAEDPVFQREFETEFLLLLDEQERKDYAKFSSLADRKAFIAFYWKSHNPDPLLPENDRLLDHLSRRAYARREFALAEPPYFDERGKYHLKYGKPVQRLRDGAGQKRLLEYKLELAFKYYSVLENESWSYVNVMPNLVVHFVKDGQAFKEIQSLKEVIVGGHRLGVLAWQWSDLLKRRFWMSPAIVRTVTTIEDLERQLVLGSGGRPARPDNSGASQRIAYRLVENLEEAEYETKLAKLKAPSTTYREINAVNKLPFSDAIAQFRGPEGQTRVEIALLSPLKDFVDDLDPLTADTASIVFSCLLRNLALDSLSGGRLQKEFPAKLAVLENLSHAVGHLTMLAFPQQGELALQVKNERNDRLGFSQKSFTIRDFSGRQLMMSEVQFFFNVTTANQRQVLPAFERQNVVLAPYPYEEVRQSLPLFCYFEVYNLQSSGMVNEYELTYRVIQDRSRQGVFKKLSKSLSGAQEAVSISVSNLRPIVADAANELLALDLSHLEKGPYRLEVIVADVKNKQLLINAQREFTIND